MRIGIFFTKSDKIVGCFKVVHNLINGLKELGHEVLENKTGDYNGCLQKESCICNAKALIGPEIMVVPTEYPKMWTYYKNWTQPSQWVIDYMRTFDITKNNNFHVWPVGIDTERFKPKKNIKYDCLVYYKDVTKQVDEYDLQLVRMYLKKYKQSYVILKYGSYNENQYINAINSSRYCIYLAGTESQGIAYMEAMSMDLPFYVIDMTEFIYRGYKFSNKNVSSAPYFDTKCGIKHSDLSRFNEFLSNVDKYNPRQYILDNHTLKMGAQKYVDILEKI